MDSPFYLNNQRIVSTVLMRIVKYDFYHTYQSFFILIQKVLIVLNDFAQPNADYFYFKSSSDKELFVKKKVLEDNVIPAGNSELAKNLFVLGTLLENQQYLEKAKTMVFRMSPRVSEHSAFYYNWFDLYSLNTARFLEVAIMGHEWQKQLQTISSYFIPYCLKLGGDIENFSLLKGKLQKDKTMIYVCLDKTCEVPKESLDQHELMGIYRIKA